jgi:hypothetical protein
VLTFKGQQLFKYIKKENDLKDIISFEQRTTDVYEKGRLCLAFEGLTCNNNFKRLILYKSITVAIGKMMAIK